MAFTVVIAMIVAIVVFMLRMYGKAHTVVIPRPKLACDLYMINIVFPALRGVLLFSTPLFFLLIILKAIFKDLQILYPFSADNSVTSELTLTLQKKYNFQRFGLLFFCTGVYILGRAAKAVVPVPTREQVGTFTKQGWYKTHFMFCKILFVIFQTFIVVATKLPLYKQYVAEATIIVLVLQTVFMTIIGKMLPDLLLVTSFKMVKQLIAKTCSLGVAPFTAFLVQYLSQLAIAIMTRAVQPTAMKIIKAYVDKLKKSRRLKRIGLNFLYRLNPRKADEVDRSMSTGGAALKSRGQYKGAEILMLELAATDLNQNAVLFVAAIFQPLFISIIVLFAEELGITTDFGGVDLVFYIIFGGIMLLFQFLYDLLVSNCMETAYGWKLNEYMKRARDAFEVRLHFFPEKVSSRKINIANESTLFHNFPILYTFCVSSTINFFRAMSLSIEKKLGF